MSDDEKLEVGVKHNGFFRAKELEVSLMATDL